MNLNGNPTRHLAGKSVVITGGERGIGAAAAHTLAHAGATVAVTARNEEHVVDVAREAKGTGVTVNAVCPGYVDTPLLNESIGRIMQRTGQPRETAMSAILEDSDQPTLIRAEEVADAILPLLLRDADRTSGETIVIDGNDAQGGP